MKHADVFIGVSGPNAITKEMVASMNQNAIVFALANPTPEIAYQEAIDAGAKIAATGRSDFPNQINNVLAFPGIFKGLLNSNIKKVTSELKVLVAKKLASFLNEEELSSTNIIPGVFETKIVDLISNAIIEFGNQQKE
jgi:malate dehydrogenase (oxaloacetate-decarboxylating)